MSDDEMVALFNVAAHYHSGQWSRGYRLMCRLAKGLVRRGAGQTGYESLDHMSRKQKMLYRAFAAYCAERM